MVGSCKTAVGSGLASLFSNTDRYAKCNTLVLARNMTGKIRIL